MTEEYEIAVLGAGSGGLTAAGFAARIGARVVLIEKDRIGGDCTWNGCVPSKALLKAAKVAYEIRTAANYGIRAGSPDVDMAQVREYIRGCIRQVAQTETPEYLQTQGIETVSGTARFLDPHTIAAGDRTIRAKHILITTGAKPAPPNIRGIETVSYLTYEQVFEVDRLPQSLIIAGGGPIGVEIAQAWQRLGCQVTIVARQLLPREEPSARQVIQNVLTSEGVRVVTGRVLSVKQDGNEIVAETGETSVRGESILLASGRRPNVALLDLNRAGITWSEKGIPVDAQLRTNVKHIYAAGDVLGGHQFTHYAGWQAFQAVRNALLPGHSAGFPEVLPWVTFTDPEVARVGMTAEEAQAKFGGHSAVRRWELSHTDRAICDHDTAGFIEVVTGEGGKVLGATIVAARAGEVIMELALAMRHDWKLTELASAIHPYPTYATAVQQMAAEAAVDDLVTGTAGKLLLKVSGYLR